MRRALDRPAPYYPEAAVDSSGSRVLFEAALRYSMGLAYGILMFLSYRELSRFWAYIGFDYRPMSVPVVIGLLLVSAIPALLLARRPRSLAEFGAWVLYFTLFLPALIIPPLQGWATTSAAFALFFTTFGSVIGFIVLTRSPGRPWRIPRFDHSIFWVTILSLYGLLHGLILLSFAGIMSFAGFDQVYEQRTAAAAAAGGAIGYVLSNAAGALNPFLIATGLADRKWWRVALGVLGQLIVYSTIAGKIVLVSMLVIGAVFLLFDRRGQLRPMRVGMGLTMVALIGFPLVATYEPVTGTLSNIIDLVYVRTLYLPGVLVGAYSDFFSIYPVTYFSHSIIGQAFFDYPYGQLSIGQVVGAYVTPSLGYEVNNYNANFIAADGITSLGVIGIPIVMLLAIGVLRGLDRLLGELDFRVRCAAFVPFLMWLADGSIFTALLTGGGLVLTILLWLWGGTRQPTSGVAQPS